MPESLFDRIILSCSNPADIVFDPMFGTAAALALAKRLGRKTLGCEISRPYYDRAVERMAAAVSSRKRRPTKDRNVSKSLQIA